MATRVDSERPVLSKLFVFSGAYDLGLSCCCLSRLSAASVGGNQEAGRLTGLWWPCGERLIFIALLKDSFFGARDSVRVMGVAGEASPGLLTSWFAVLAKLCDRLSLNWKLDCDLGNAVVWEELRGEFNGEARLATALFVVWDELRGEFNGEALPKIAWLVGFKAASACAASVADSSCPA